MAAIVAGEQYGLSSRISSENNSLIFVKLTDSAYRAIEEYIKNGDRNQKPTIQFLKNEGHLSIPAQSSRAHVFNFSLSSFDDEATFECLKGSGGKILESIGAPVCQMRVLANEDVYETTRYRMAVAEEQSKKNCTRVIKPSLADIGRRVKKTNTTVIPPINTRPSIPSTNSYNMPVTTNSTYQRVATTQHNRNMSSNNAQKPGNPEIMRRPIKERLIHLLAVRPYKKPELWERMHRDGIKERDRKSLGSELSQVAILRDNTYHLIRHVWNDVQEDWPFYTEQDRQSLKRRKPQNLTPPGSSDTGSSASGQSPTSTHPGSPPSAIQGAPKRPGYYETVDGFQTKRPRISHYRKPADSYRPSPVDSYLPNSHLDKREKDRDINVFVNSTREHSFYRDYDRPSYEDYELDAVLNQNRASKLSSDCNKMNTYVSEKRSESPATVTSSVQQDDPTPRRNEYRDYRTSTQTQDTDNIQENTVSGSEVMTNGEVPEYVREYTRIVDDEQRRRYKQDFNANYDEYKKLHAIMEKVSQKFAELDARLRKSTPGTPEYKNIKSQIWKDYQENKKNAKHQDAKKRFQYLHEKLSHIKRLVAEYDEQLQSDY